MAQWNNDVPGLQYGMARRGEQPCAILISDSKIVNLFGKGQNAEAAVSGKQVAFAVEPYALVEVEVRLAQDKHL